MGKSSRGSRCCHRWHSGGEKEKERGRDDRCPSSPLSLRLCAGFVFASLMQVRKDSGPYLHERKGWMQKKASEMNRWGSGEDAGKGTHLDHRWTPMSTSRTNAAPSLSKPDRRYRECVSESPNVTEWQLHFKNQQTEGSLPNYYSAR